MFIEMQILLDKFNLNINQFWCININLLFIIFIPKMFFLLKYLKSLK